MTDLMTTLANHTDRAFFIRLMSYNQKQAILREFKASGRQLQEHMNAPKGLLNKEILRLFETTVKANWSDAEEWNTFDNEAAEREYQEWEIEHVDIYVTETTESVATFFLKPSPPITADAFNLMMGMPVDDLETAQAELTEYDRSLGLC